jgi:hypothetical protein
MQTSKLFESAIENLFGAYEVITASLAFLIQTRKLNTRPELMMAQDAIEKPIKINMISLTRRLAFRNKSRIFMSVTA